MKKYISLVIFAIANIVFASVLVRYSETGPIASGAYRLLLAVPFLFIVDFTQVKFDNQTFNLKIGLSASMAGIFFALDLACYNISLLHTSLAEANLLTNMVPFVIAPISIIFFKEKISPKFLYTVIIAVAGLYLLMSAASNNLSHQKGNYFALMSTVFYSFFLSNIKTATKNYYVNRVMMICCISGGLLLLIISFLKHEIILPRSLYGWGIVLAIMVCGQILGQTMFAIGIKKLPLQLASLFLLFSPIFASIYAYFLFNEKLGIRQTIGMAMIMVAVFYGKRILESSNTVTG